MKQKYCKPLLKPWIVFDKVDEDTYFATDYQTYDGCLVGAALAEFAMKLDGRYDPYKDVYQTYSPEQIDAMLDKLESGGFLRHDSTSPFGKRHIPFFVSHGAVKSRLDFGLFLKVLNWTWMVLCVPALILGSKVWLDAHPVFLSSFSAVLGIMVGLLLCPLLHQLAHAVALTRHGGHVFEMGIHMQGWLPKLYSFEEMENARENSRVQIIASGAALDCLVGGVLTILAMKFQSDFALGAAISCVLYATHRMSFRSKMDGMNILEELIIPRWDADTIPDYVKDGLDTPVWWQEVDESIYEKPESSVPVPPLSLSSKFPVPPPVSVDERESIVKDFLDSEVLFVTTVLMILKICNTFIYGLALLSVIFDFFFALL